MNKHSVPVEEYPMTSYTFTVELEPDGDGWRAFYAPLEHLGASTWGHTKDEALQNVQELLGTILAELEEDGVPIPDTEGMATTEGTSVTITR